MVDRESRAEPAVSPDAGSGLNTGGGVRAATGRRPPRLMFLTLTAERGLRRRWAAGPGGELGISASACGVLLYLATNPGASTGEAADAVQASPAGMSGLLSRMETSGFITRTPDPADARTIRLDLTAGGRKTLGVVRESIDELNGRINAGFSDEELATVARWLRRVSAPTDPVPAD